MERTSCTMWLEITLALSQHWRQNEPIKQMAPDPSLATEQKDVNRESAAVNDPTRHSQQRPRQGRRKSLQKPNKYNKEKHASGRVNDDVGQMTMNGVTLRGHGALFNDLRCKYNSSVDHYYSLFSGYFYLTFHTVSLVAPVESKP